jgi:methyl-accepting chemotaxis protein
MTPIFNMGLKKKLLVSFIILAIGPILTLGAIGYYVTAGPLRLAVTFVVISSTFSILYLAPIFSRNLTWLLFRLLEETKRVEGGDLSGRLNVEFSADEIGQLTLSFKKMVKNLRELVINVMEAGSTVSSSSQELAAAGEQMNASIEEVSSSIQKIAETAQNQSIQINEVGDGIKGVAAKAKDISSNLPKKEGNFQRRLLKKYWQQTKI